MPLRRRIGEETTQIGSGARDRYVMIQSRPDPDHGDSSGYPINGWQDFQAAHMWRQDMAGEEEDRPANAFATIDTRWEMAYLPAMDPELVDVAKLRRLVYRGKTYDIVQATLIGRNGTIEIMTRGNTRVEP